MAKLRKALAGIAATVVLGASLVGIPAQAAEIKSSATDPANVVQALKFIDELNALRAKQNPTFTPQQIADAWNADYNTTQFTAANFNPKMSDGAPREALKVNDDLMTWAQARANELAKLGASDNHAGTNNGAPS